MKTRLRKITVDGRRFTWRVVQHGDVARVRVWLADKPREIWAEFEVPHADPWLNVGTIEGAAPIQPTQVAELIRGRMPRS
jgi:hypothetical protein